MFKNKKVLISLILIVLLAIVCSILFFNTKDNKYIIEFNTDGGNLVAKIEAKENEKVVLPTNVTKEGFIFNGWVDLDGKNVSTEYIVTQNITLKAIWLSKEKETINITFNTDGGSKIDGIILEKGETLSLPNEPTKDGYVFKGWVDKNEMPIYDKVLLANDTELKAIWEKEEVKPAKKQYYCEKGYTLNGKKCIKTESINAKATSVCPEGSIMDNNLCINTKETISAKRVCNSIEGYSTGVYVAAAGGCFYGELGPSGIDNYTCTNYYNGKYHNGHCYSKLVQGANSYKTSCDNGFTLYTPKTNNTVCAKVIEKQTTFSCEKGYTLDESKCTKTTTVDAKLK